mgnify:FL=1
MCIYLGDSTDLTYYTQEHVLPAALGCCTKLEKGVVSDQANEYFSPIERDVIEHSSIQMSRILFGPGKRGKLAEKYASTSEVSVVNLNGKIGLGYMKGDKGYILNQFIIDEKNNIQFQLQSNDELDVQNEIETLKKHFLSMGEKYVYVKMPSDVKCIYVTYFKDKIHIGFHDILSFTQIQEIKNLLSRNFTYSKLDTSCGHLSATIDIKNEYKKISIFAIKSALNTLAFIKGAEYITQTTDYKTITQLVTSGSEEVLNYVKGIGFDEVEKNRKNLHLDREQLACILSEEGNKLKARLFVYEYGFEVSLCDACTVPFNILLDGIVCDWKNRKDYRYLEFLKIKGVLC